MARPNVNPVERLARIAWASHVRHVHGNRNFSSIAAQHGLSESSRVMLYHISRGSRSPVALLHIAKAARPTYEIGPEGIPVWPVLRNTEITYDEFSAMLPPDPTTTGIHPPTFGSLFGDPTKEASMHAIADYVALIESIVEEELARLDIKGEVAEKLRQNIADANAVINDFHRHQPWITFCQLVLDFRALLRIDLSPGLLSMLARQHLGGGRKASGLQTQEQRREFVRGLFDKLARRELMKADMTPYGLTVDDLMDVAHARL